MKKIKLYLGITADSKIGTVGKPSRFTSPGYMRALSKTTREAQNVLIGGKTIEAYTTSLPARNQLVYTRSPMLTVSNFYSQKSIKQVYHSSSLLDLLCIAEGLPGDTLICLGGMKLALEVERHFGFDSIEICKSFNAVGGNICFDYSLLDSYKVSDIHYYKSTNEEVIKYVAK